MSRVDFKELKLECLFVNSHTELSFIPRVLCENSLFQKWHESNQEDMQFWSFILKFYMILSINNLIFNFQPLNYHIDCRSKIGEILWCILQPLMKNLRCLYLSSDRAIRQCLLELLNGSLKTTLMIFYQEKTAVILGKLWYTSGVKQRLPVLILTFILWFH